MSDEPTAEDLAAQENADARAAVGVHLGDDVKDEDVDWSRRPTLQLAAQPAEPQLEAAVGVALAQQDGAAASKRAIRTLIQNVSLDVSIAVVLVLYPIVSGASSLADFQWKVLGFLVGKTIAVTVLSFVMRRFKVVPSTL